MRRAHVIFSVIIALALIFSVITVVLLNGNQQNVSPTPTPSATNSPAVTASQTPTATPALSPSPSQKTLNGAPLYSYSVVQSYPHSTSAFTEGLLVESDGVLLESTGLDGASSLRRVNLSDGTVLQQYDLPNGFFGEGIAVMGDRIVQLTWQNHIGFVYNRSSFELLSNFSVSTEGWGLTYDGNRLIMSDGSSKLYFLDTDTYQVTGSINVHDDKGAVVNLNELEYINGTVYANIWYSQKIAVINPQTGQVQAYIDLDGIYQTGSSEEVLNGIAYDTTTNQLFVTGKDWSKIFEINIQKSS
jgi:glutaminyl-peptide cyclotransferase